jgi:3-hydroxyisobutyrate dehydrogenase-like beta-hydroxyacid dehydrogenase
LKNSGLTVLTCLKGRSTGSRRLASDAGMEDTGSLAELVARADVFLSILPPAAALDFANVVSPLIHQHSPQTLLVDCNAVSPQTVAGISAIAASHGVRFQDAGIIGAAPQADRIPVRIYTSGPFGNEMSQLGTEHITIKNLGDEPGRASAIKMVYASVTKATNALRTAAAIAGERLGVGDEIRAEWQHSLPTVYEAMEVRLPLISADAGRWAGEMREIAETYESVGLTPLFHEASEWVFEYLAATELGAETKTEAREKMRSVQEVLEIVSGTKSD